MEFRILHLHWIEGELKKVDTPVQVTKTFSLGTRRLAHG